MKRPNGFAISGILYAILLLFLMLLLLILGNFQSRKVLFDKQKSDVLEKLQNTSITKTYNYNGTLQTFVTPIDGCYQMELWGASLETGSNQGGYAKGDIYLYQGIKLYVSVGVSESKTEGDITLEAGSPTSIRTEEKKQTTIILKASGGNGETGFAYSEDTSEDITIGPVLSATLNNNGSLNHPIGDQEGYVKITYLSEFCS